MDPVIHHAEPAIGNAGKESGVKELPKISLPAVSLFPFYLLIVSHRFVLDTAKGIW